MNGIHRTGRQAVAQTITVIIPEKLRFSVHHADGSLVTGSGTGTTAITFLFINLNNSSYHFTGLLVKTYI